MRPRPRGILPVACNQSALLSPVFSRVSAAPSAAAFATRERQLGNSHCWFGHLGAYHWLRRPALLEWQKGGLPESPRRFDCGATALMQEQTRTIVAICQSALSLSVQQSLCSSTFGETQARSTLERWLPPAAIVISLPSLLLARACSCGVQRPGS